MSFSKELIKATNKILKLSDLYLTQHQTKDDKEEEFKFIDFLHKSQIKSNSQLFQDMFVVYELNNKTNGFFVEFGATDGVSLSNSYILEKELGWNGILAEPAKIWHERLKQNRKCEIDLRCVWKKSSETVNFNEVNGDAEFSTMQWFSKLNDQAANTKKRYSVQTISLNDLLAEHNAPENIDYLSIDTEGSEFEILNSLDFKRWHVKIITVEHNFVPKNRKRIHKLLTTKGYERKLRSLSRWDDWYIKI